MHFEDEIFVQDLGSLSTNIGLYDGKLVFGQLEEALLDLYSLTVCQSGSQFSF